MPTSRRTQTQEGRQQYSIESIKNGLELTDANYKSFYTAVEKEVIAQGWTGRTFRSISEKEMAQREIIRLVAGDRDTAGRFPKTIQRMSSPTGQSALGCLVYKICSNYRRRSRKNKSVRNSTFGKGDVRCSALADEGQKADLCEGRGQPSGAQGMQPTSGDIRQVAVWIMEPDGKRKAACRLGDLGVNTGEAEVSDAQFIDSLSFERFCRIMEDDHGFEKGGTSFVWCERGPEGDVRCQSTIDNRIQWLTAIAYMMAKGQDLMFVGADWAL